MEKWYYRICQPWKWKYADKIKRMIAQCFNGCFWIWIFVIVGKPYLNHFSIVIKTKIRCEVNKPNDVILTACANYVFFPVSELKFIGNWTREIDFRVHYFTVHLSNNHSIFRFPNFSMTSIGLAPIIIKKTLCLVIQVLYC